jgi:acyl carrier protein
MTHRALEAIAEPTMREQQVLLLLGEITGHPIDGVARDQRLADLDGWDSLAVLDLLTGLDTTLGVVVELEPLGAVETLGDLFALIDAAAHQRGA